MESWDPRRESTPRSAGWVLSHLTAYYRFCARNLTEEELPLPGLYALAHPSMFDDLARRPSARGSAIRRVDLFQHNHDAFETLISRAESLTARELLSTPRGSMKEYAPDKLACIERAAWHEGWHTGQVADIRRGLKLPAKF